MCVEPHLHFTFVLHDIKEHLLHFIEGWVYRSITFMRFESYIPN